MIVGNHCLHFLPYIGIITHNMCGAVHEIGIHL